MLYENNDRLREYLDRGAAGAYREHLRHPRFEFKEEAFAAALDQVTAQFPDLPLEDAEARAAFRLLTSGIAPEVAVPLPSRWFRALRFLRETSIQGWPWLKLAWAVAVLLLCVTAVALLSALVARAEPTPQNLRAYRNAMRGLNLLALPTAAAPQQPGGIILQFQQGGSPLATRPAGLVAFNCSTGLSCSFSGTTFTLTSTGAGGGTGCLPPGTPARLLYDDGAGGCLDTGLTWSGSTATAPSGVTLTYSGTGIINARQWASTGITNTESLGKIPIGNGDGTATWADPFVSGITPHDAVATSTNPVLTGGYAGATAPTDVSNDGDAVRAWFLRNGSQVFNLASGGTLVTLGQKAMASSLPVVLSSDQSAIPASQSGTWNINNVSGTVSLPTGAATSANQSTQITALQLIDNLPHANDVALNNGVPIMGQLDDTATGTVTENNVSTVRITSGRALHVAQQGALPAGNNNIGDVDVASVAGNVTVVQGTGANLHMVCDSGCGGSGGTSATDNSAFTGGSTSVTPIGALYDTTPPAVTDGNIGAPRMDSNRYLFTNCVVGCSGGATTPADAFATPTTAGLSASFGMGYNGSSWDMLRSGDKNNVAAITGVLNTAPVGRYDSTQPTLTSGRWNLLQLSSRGELLVTPGTTGFSVTANAGTNLNTSSLALESGGNLATIASPIATDDATTHSTGSTKVMGIGAVATPTDTALNANDIGMPGMSNNRELWSVIRDAAGNARGANVNASNELQVNATQSGTWNVTNVSGTISLPTGAATETTLATLSQAQGSTTSGQKGPLIQGAVSTSDPSYTNGQTSPLSLTTDGKLRVQASVSTGALAIKDASNNDTCVGYYATTPCLNMPVQFASEKAEDAAASSGDYGVFVQGVRTDTLAAQTSATGDYGGVSIDSLGRMLSVIAPTATYTSGNATTTGTSDTSLISAAGASTKIYVTALQCANSGSTTAVITLKDGSGGSTLGYTIVPAGGGSNIVYPIPLATTANTALYFAAGSSSTTIYCSAQGYKAP
jgi:hypothetical protein